MKKRDFHALLVGMQIGAASGKLYGVTSKNLKWDYIELGTPTFLHGQRNHQQNEMETDYMGEHIC